MDPHRGGHTGQLAPRENMAATLSIHVLHDEVLLHIFDHYRMAERWQRVIYASPLRLKLQLYCTYGTNVPLLVDIWPTLPIVLDYPDWDQEDEIWVSLNYRDRIQEIKFSADEWTLYQHTAEMKYAMPVLESLTYECTYSDRTIPNEFLGGYTPRLHTLYLRNTMISPRLPFLLSANGLVNFQIRGYLPFSISPDDLLEYLQTMPRLERLVIYDDTSDDPGRRACCWGPSLTEPITLGKLLTFKYTGDDMFLDYFLSQLHLPEVLDFSITIFHDPYSMPHFPAFANRSLGNFRPCVVNMGYSKDDVYVVASRWDTDANLTFQVKVPESSDDPRDWPLVTMKQMSSDLSFVLASAVPYRSMRLLKMEFQISPQLAHALTVETEDPDMTLLPALHGVGVVCRNKDEHRKSVLLDIFSSFAAARKKAGHDVAILHLIE
ncbi:hypothetical protein BC834DRAFT_311714 [Gloeopeniophorella convolvens]|nr:hypothetical protein BC834DRAFT_311714 [Gloeopeniophorella convolvens]